MGKTGAYLGAERRIPAVPSRNKLCTVVFPGNFIPIARMLIILIVIGIGTVVEAQDKSTASPGPVSLTQQLLDPDITDQVFKLRLLPLTKDELAELAKEWLEITRESVKQAADANIAVSTGTGPAVESLRSNLGERLQQRNRLLRKLDVILDEWSAKGAADAPSPLSYRLRMFSGLRCKEAAVQPYISSVCVAAACPPVRSEKTHWSKPIHYAGMRVNRSAKFIGRMDL